MSKMSVICQNFVQNAWKKDLCSNCFKSVGDHESIDVDHGEINDSIESENLNGKYVSQSSHVHASRSESAPHTTWKNLITERNNKNSQPFKLENGFQGRLLTINKALNGTDKQSNGESPPKDKSKPKLLNGLSVKTVNGDAGKPVAAKPENAHAVNNDHKTTSNGNLSNGGSSEEKSNGVGSHKPCKSVSPNKQKIPNGEVSKNSVKAIQSKFTKSNSSEIPQSSPNLHSILKKSTSTPQENRVNLPRRGSNVGFKDEEPLVIGYGGRDFSPEELDWEMASSDGEQENNSDSLDETEDDKVFSKMTKVNTEFNSDNANLLHTSNSSPCESESNNQKQSDEVERRVSVSDKVKEINQNNRTGAPANSVNEIMVKTTPESEANDDSEKTNQTKVKKEDSVVTFEKETSSPVQNEEKQRDISETKGAKQSVNVAMNGDENKQEEKAGEGAAGKISEDAAISGVDVKNSPEIINGATPLSGGVDARSKTENSGKKVDSGMFSDGNDSTWQEKSAAGGGSECWQDTDAIPGQILQAINTSLTNRHKMRESPELGARIEEEEMSLLEENETNKISLSVNNERSAVCDETEESSAAESAANAAAAKGDQAENVLNVEPRESFLHGVVSKPSAIYGPASDLFVSRSNSSSSSSSDEQRKSHISLSFNVIVNGGDSRRCNDVSDEYDNCENINSNTPEESVANGSSYPAPNNKKPEIPTKPTKTFSSEINKQYGRSESLNSTVSIDDSESGMKNDDTNDVSIYSSVPHQTTTSINLVDPYAESNIYHEVNEKDFKIQESDQTSKGRESKLAALAMELEQARHNSTSTKRQAPAPPKIPDPPLEDPPSCTGRVSPVAELPPHSFSTFRGEAMGFSSASSTTSTSSQDTETGYASWNLHGESEDHPKHSKSKSSFLLTQYSKCKMLAKGYAEDGAKARKKFSIKKLLKINKETDAAGTFDPNCPNPKAWKYSDHFERPRAKLEIIHPMDLENKTVTVNPGFESLQSNNSMSSFSPSFDDSFRNSVSSDYGSIYSDTLSPSQDVKKEANYEYIPPRQSSTEDQEESSSKAGTSSSTSPTPSRSSTASQASTLTSGSSKNGANHRPPKPPPPPRAHSLLPSNKSIRNSDGTFKFPAVNGDTSSSDEVTVPVTKPQAPRRQCKSAIIRSDYSNLEDHKVLQNLQEVSHSTEDISEKNDCTNQEDSWRNTSSVQIIHTESNIPSKEEAGSSIISLQDGVYDNLQNLPEEPNIQTSITIKTSASNQKEKIAKSMLSRNKHPPLTKSPARPPPIYSKPQNGNFSKNLHPWKTLEDSYLALTSSNRELLIKLMNQALKKRKNLASKLNKFEFHWTDFEIDASQSSSVFAFGEKIAYHATMQKCPEYELTLVVSIQQQNRLHENSELKYPVFGKFTDCIPSDLLDNAGDNELVSMPATILVLDRSNILTVEYYSESLSESVTEENEKEICFIILQLIQSLKTLQVQGIESIDMNCQNLLLVKTKRDRYHTLVFLYDICYEENDYSAESCKVSLCQYTLMLLFQLLRIQEVNETVTGTKFTSNMSRKVFETAFSLLSEEKAVSLSQTKTLFECYLWGVTKVLESLQNLDDCDTILHRWLDIERSTCIKTIVNDESNDINLQNEYYSQFLIRTNVRNIREVASYL